MLTEYQKGSIFGAVILAVAFAAAFSDVPSHPSSIPPPEQPPIGRHQDESLWSTFSHDPVAIFTCLLATIGIAQAYLFWWQLRLIRESLADAKDSATAAKHTAKATGDAVTLSKEIAVRELRAYVLVDEPRLDANPETDWFDAHIAFKNYGKTPAYLAQVTAEHSYRAAIHSSEILPLSPAARKYAQTTIPPEKFHVLRIPGIIGKDNFNSGFGAYKIYVWGTINYIDAFGDSHFTRFQIVHHITNINQFAYCESGNCTDDRLTNLNLSP